MKSLTFAFLFLVFCLAGAAALQGQENTGSYILQLENEPAGESERKEMYRMVPSILSGSITFSQASLPDIADRIGSRAGLSFAASAVIPGLGQAANRNWLKSGIFLAIESAAIYGAIEYRNRGRRGERSYEQWADQNWSVVQYAAWLVEYHDVHDISNPYIDQLRAQLNGVSAAFDPDIDWQIVSLALLRNAERNSPFILTDDLTANNFSHVLPDYGSQQYYELISKYYQYQAGWRDYHDFHDSLGHTGALYNQRFFIDRNGAYASPLFWEGADRAGMFNNNYRTGRNFSLLLIANHVFSAFDAYFTVRLKQNRISATPSLIPGHQLSMKLRF
ncbi:hypothetical protein [Rhodohalobacter mucosus]|uniref:DUF5683 domain-containing protein n=1 Tax=Rhodohalobacter mucosus TaxID=2079485 RepID=A0A316TQU8_9BACT|nr:hypothetical protein [Rhodohalobacter mucosus]PWN06987.1 hypothetical protein DDZ15_06865 [Rhodohalobacter mucosus]